MKNYIEFRKNFEHFKAGEGFSEGQNIPALWPGSGGYGADSKMEAGDFLATNEKR